MRLSLRFVLPLLLALGAFAWAAVPLVDAWMTRWYIRDLDTRSNFVAKAIQEPLGESLRAGPHCANWRVLRSTERRRAAAGRGRPVHCTGCRGHDASSAFPVEIRCDDSSHPFRTGARKLVTADGPLYATARPAPHRLRCPTRGSSSCTTSGSSRAVRKSRGAICSISSWP